MIRALNVTAYTGEDEAARRVDRVSVVVDMPATDAERLAAHYRERTEAGLDILADEAKEAARPILAALAAAGFGGS